MAEISVSFKFKIASDYILILILLKMN